MSGLRCEIEAVGVSLVTGWGDDDSLRYVAQDCTDLDGRRLAAAWNAVEGISTDDLEKGAVKELVDALAACRDWFVSVGADGAPLPRVLAALKMVSP